MLTPVKLRHLMHQNPELMFEEYSTTAMLEENISGLPGIKIHKPLETGLLAEYTVNGGSYLLFRADIDALPINEETGAPFASLNNYMHACGHDVHTSILYSFLKYVVENKLDHNVLFLFQPGEEGGGGAKKVIDSDILNNYNISKAFALHVTDEYPEGTIASTPGVLFASAYELDIEFIGKNAHVAFPADGINAFDGLRRFLDLTIKFINQQNERIIFGYGKTVSGTARNIIPAYARLEGTIRTLNSTLSKEFYDKLITILDTIKSEDGVNYNIKDGTLYTEVTVDTGLFEHYERLLSKQYKFIDCGSKMTGEDFGFISALYPSFMFWLGTSRGEYNGLHSPRFLPHDEVIDIGKNIFKEIIMDEIK